MGKTCIISAVLSMVFCNIAHSHRPIFSEKAATDPNTAVLIKQPAISQVIYREITEESKQVWLAFDANEEFELFIQIGVPVLDRLNEFRPAMLVAGPGLPEGDVQFKLPEGAGSKEFTTDSVDEPRFFHEHFTGTDSWILRSETLVLPGSGRYYVVAYVPSGDNGKLWLSVGRKESFGLAEWAKFGEWKKKIRKFHEVSDKAGGFRIPVLSEIGDLLRSNSKKTKSKAATAITKNGVKIHTVETQYQNGEQEIHVLLPDDYKEGKLYHVLYLLPVEKGFNQRYGYGLGVLKEMNAHNKYDIIIVQMGFEKEPWYGDHASNPRIRQASYLKEFIIPFIEKHYSAKDAPEGRLLMGFSKSGWGAFSLILTYPEFFGYAASWDAPMFFDRFHYSMEQVYGTLEQLNAYRPDLLVSGQKKHFQKKARLVLTGEMDWGRSVPAFNGGSHTVEMQKLLEKEGIKHIFND
ncbi:MAG: alpha/beta hydrolase-fold protein, partial [Planctomycetota bacterium]